MTTADLPRFRGDLDDAIERIDSLVGRVEMLAGQFEMFQTTLEVSIAPLVAQNKRTERCIELGLTLATNGIDRLASVAVAALNPSALKWIALILILVFGGSAAALMVFDRLLDAAVIAGEAASSVTLPAPDLGE